MARKPGLACHACNRSDFATEASLKRHTAKFHTPGVKSPRGFRVRRDPQKRGYAVFKGRAMVKAYADKGRALRAAKSMRNLDPFGDGKKVQDITVRPVPWAYVRMDKQYPKMGDSYTEVLHKEAKRKFRGSGRRYSRDAQRDPSVSDLQAAVSKSPRHRDTTAKFSTVIAPGPWIVCADASDYNSRRKKNGKPYIAKGSGPLTGRMLHVHAERVIAHANAQDAERFFELYAVGKLRDGTSVVLMEFGT